MENLNKIYKQIAEANKNKDIEEAERLKEIANELKEEEREKRLKLVRKAENEIADKMLKKEELEDGVWYEGPGDFARQVTRARWNEERGKFIYDRYKFGWFEDEMDYFGDVINERYAGFAPMNKE